MGSYAPWMSLIVGWAMLVPACSSSSEGKGACSNPGNLGFCVCDGRSAVDPVSECSEATMGGPVVCCKGKDSCTCGLFECSISSLSCSCTSVGVGGSTDPCTGAICCAAPGGVCSCGSVGCSSNRVQVDSCSSATALCEAGAVRVDKCTP